jgi:UDP-N-acetylmuramate dehydrogenase
MENLEAAVAEIKKELPGMIMSENEKMSGHTSMKVGGAVRAYAVPQEVSSLSKVCFILKEHDLAPYILGNGTNVVFPDAGCPELFVVSTEKLNQLFLCGEGKIYAGAGVSLSKLAGFAQQNALTGLEFASGIPGTVGGGTVMNAGAYGGEMKDCIESVVIYYLPEQKLYELSREQCKFAYRSSIFQMMAGCVILSVVFSLESGDGEQIAEKMRELNARRRDKQPLDLPSAGSAFKRPEGHYAAALIDEAGLKGYTVGGAQVSEKHAGFIVNKGGATAKDVYELMDYVRHAVYEKSGVVLAPEIILLPEDYRLEDKSPKAPRNRVFENNSDFHEGAK